MPLPTLPRAGCSAQKRLGVTLQSERRKTRRARDILAGSLMVASIGLVQVRSTRGYAGDVVYSGDNELVV